MSHRTVQDVMTRQVVRVAPTTGFHEILALLTEFDITAVPVVDDADHPIGIVSEADLMYTQEAQEDPSSPLPPPPAQAEGPDRTGAETAQELMTAPALCTTPSTSVVAAARSMARHHVKRLPVVDEDGRLAGMVSRSDLLQVFLRDDQVIQHDIVEEVLGQVEGVSPAAVGVEVTQGRVVLSGVVEPRRLAPIVLRLCRSVDGVVSVTDRTASRSGPVTSSDHTGCRSAPPTVRPDPEAGTEMATSFDPATAQAPDLPARVSLTPTGASPGRLDGAWWPRSHDLVHELPALAAEMDPRWGRIIRVTVNPTHWPVIPREVQVTGHVIQLGWFEQEQDADEVMVCSFIPRRLELLVIPPETEASVAERLMTAAADPANAHTGTDLLAAYGAPTAGRPTVQK